MHPLTTLVTWGVCSTFSNAIQRSMFFLLRHWTWGLWYIECISEALSANTLIHMGWGQRSAFGQYLGPICSYFQPIKPTHTSLVPCTYLWVYVGHRRLLHIENTWRALQSKYICLVPTTRGAPLYLDLAPSSSISFCSVEAVLLTLTPQGYLALVIDSDINITFSLTCAQTYFLGALPSLLWPSCGTCYHFEVDIILLEFRLESQMLTSSLYSSFSDYYAMCESMLRFIWRCFYWHHGTPIRYWDPREHLGMIKNVLPTKRVIHPWYELVSSAMQRCPRKHHICFLRTLHLTLLHAQRWT